MKILLLEANLLTSCEIAAKLFITFGFPVWIGCICRLISKLIRLFATFKP